MGSSAPGRPPVSVRNLRRNHSGPDADAPGDASTTDAGIRASVCVGSTIASDAIRSGARPASRSACRAPSDDPTRWTAGRSPASRNARSQCTWSAVVRIGTRCMLAPGPPSGSSA